MKNIRYIIALLCGILFGIGLVISGMTNTHKVIGFLDIMNWDFDLLFVMVGAIAVCLLPFYIAKKGKKPLADSKYYLPTNRIIDSKLISGAILFGIGWGIYGLCPAPAIIALQYGDTSIYLFFIAMLVGFFLHQLLSKRK